MDKIKLGIDVIKDLRQLATSLESFMKELDSNEESPGEAKAAKEELITLEMVRAVLAEKSQSGKQPEVKALITKYGARKLTDINPSSYKKLLAEAAVL